MMSLARESLTTIHSSHSGAHVISMTSSVTDVLTVLWLWRQTFNGSHEQLHERCLPIAPFLETIDDLQHGPEILRRAGD